MTHRQWQMLIRQLTVDKKRLGMLMILGVFGLLLWGRLLLKDVPRTATAEPESRAVERASGSAGSGGRPGRVEVVTIEVGRRLSRDPFRLPPNRYNPTFDSVEGDKLVKGGNSDREPTDERVGVDAALERARRLDLRSVVTGHKPRAVIESRVLKPGEEIDGFTLERVEDRAVLLKIDGIVIRLWM